MEQRRWTSREVIILFASIFTMLKRSSEALAKLSIVTVRTGIKIMPPNSSPLDPSSSLNSNSG